MRELAGKALDAVTSGGVKIHPEERFLATYKYWLENVKDWCISRQLWWGQRIPTWYDEDGNVYVAETEEKAKELYHQKTGKKPHPSGEVWRGLQDEDVLDTWFSSWLWPIEVFNGITQPNNADINYYYPTSVIVTGQDIIFFWVARMIMAGEEYMNEKPFTDVYFTGMVRDKQGRKMSKSLGNSPDLLDLVDRFGADAVRFGILISAPAGNDLLFDESSCEQGKNFNNKIWNALKLVKMWESRIQNSDSAVQHSNFAISWFENRLNLVKMQVEEMYKQFRLSEALKTIYSLIWDDFCSWYLEWIKPGFEQPIDAEIYTKTVDFFTELMQLLHPFMPFVTEEIYHQLKQREEDLCVRQNTKSNNADNKILKLGDLLKMDITSIRDAKTKLQLKPKEPVDLYIETSKQELYKEIESLLIKQVNADRINYTSNTEPAAFTIIGNEAKIHISTNKQVDTSSQKEQLLKDLEYQKGFLASVDKKLSNERFVQNAKTDVVEIERKKKADAEQKIKSIEETLAGMK